MLNYILVIIISLFGFFVNIESLGQTGNILIKILLFLGLGYIVYRQYAGSGLIDDKEQTPKERQTENFTASPPIKQVVLSNDEKGNLNTLLSDNEISLNSFLISQFDILYNFFLPSNGYIFVENQENDFRLFHKSIKQGISWNEPTEIPNILKLLKNHSGKVLVENNLNSNSNILPYYNASTYSPGSVLSFFTTITEEKKIIWVFDAPATGYFNEEDFKVLTQVGFTTHYVITNAFKQKHTTEELVKEKKILMLTYKLNGCSTREELTTVFIEYLAGLFEAHKLTIAMIDMNNTQMATVIKTVGRVDSIKVGARFSLDEGLCGKVLSNKQIYLIEDIEKDGYFIPRFSKNEKTNYGLRSFLAIPLFNNSEIIGLVIMEHKSPGMYTTEHKLKLKEYSGYYSAALSRFGADQFVEAKKNEELI